MVSVTISVPEKVRNTMKEFPEVNWSGLVRKAIMKKVELLMWKKQVISQFGEEEKEGFTEWSVNLGKQAKKGRSKRIKAD